MTPNVTSIMVLRHKDAGWFNRRRWLGAGIARALVEKLRYLQFARVLSLLAADQLLGSRGLRDFRPGSLRQVTDLLNLPVDGIVFGRVLVTGERYEIASHVACQRNAESVGWTGPYSELLDGINALSLRVCEALVGVAGVRGDPLGERRERFLHAGIPTSLRAFEFLCQATHTRVGTERDRLYRLAIEEDSSCASAWSGLGTHLAVNRKLGEAVRCFERQVELAPDDHDGFSSLGTACAELGQHDRAMWALQRAIELYPQGDPDVFSNLGALYHGMKKFDEALPEYARALALNPRDPDVHFNLGKCYIARGVSSDVPKAKRHIQEAVRLYGPLFIRKRRRAQDMLELLR